MRPISGPLRGRWFRFIGGPAPARRARIIKSFRDIAVLTAPIVSLHHSSSNGSLLLLFTGSSWLYCFLTPYNIHLPCVPFVNSEDVPKSQVESQPVLIESTIMFTTWTSLKNSK